MRIDIVLVAIGSELKPINKNYVLLDENPMGYSLPFCGIQNGKLIEDTANELLLERANINHRYCQLKQLKIYENFDITYGDERLITIPFGCIFPKNEGFIPLEIRNRRKWVNLIEALNSKFCRLQDKEILISAIREI